MEEGYWTGAASGGGRDPQSSHNGVVAEEGLVGGAALSNGAVGCRLDGVLVVVVVEERRLGRPTLLIEVGCRGRLAELLLRQAAE